MIRAKQLADGMTSGPLQARVWVDVETPTPEEVELLKRQYPINPLALEDAQEIGHWSRFEQYPNHLFLIFRTLETPHTPKSRTERVSYFYFPQSQVLLTYRNEPVEYVERAWESFRGGSCIWLWQQLVDRGVETFFEYVESLTDQLEDLEELALDGDDTNQVPRRVFAVRREVLRTRRLVSQAREALLHLERLPELGSDAYMFRDLTDRMGRVYEGLDAARDELSNVLEVYLSAQSNRLNKVVQALTVISVLFLPMTLWAGIYGTNFDSFSEYRWPYGRLFFWGGLVAIASLLAWWMKRRGWW
ncbi:Cobalt/magnesium transport protein CorA [Calidithermus terrae]|uniref:Cobalt/magnesium transport protein CorA n=1 Tax=Calidithermus terrae TaxID=1408545 RepID=A0A399ER81_9DEIN|nr:magnesium transporter CorA family protein [Calidithermus terrae]RIH86073.1 Cobalt/magnesium transport protein CorA [Calidithermus terrae]